MNERAWEVIVGNIGSVYQGDNEDEARKTFHEYQSQSADQYGRAAGEPVTLLYNSDIVLEWEGQEGQS